MSVESGHELVLREGLLYMWSKTRIEKRLVINVVSDDRWRLVTGSFILKSCLIAPGIYGVSGLDINLF